jgi:hypothetical protein
MHPLLLLAGGILLLRMFGSKKAPAHRALLPRKAAPRKQIAVRRVK